MADTGSTTPRWSHRTLQFFGVLHLAYGAVGVYFLLVGVVGFVASGGLARPVDVYAPYYEEAFILRTSINLILLVTLLVAGVLLLRGQGRGVFLSNVVFVTMIVYFLLGSQIYLLFGEGFRRSMAASAGTGNMGIAWQILTGYPVICLVALNLLSYKARRVSVSREHSGA